MKSCRFRTENQLTNDKLTALDATWCKEDVKIMFTVLSSLELIENCIFGKWTEALSADEAVLVPNFAA